MAKAKDKTMADTPETEVTDAAPEVVAEEAPVISASTLAEMEAGRKHLEAIAASATAETA